MPAVKNFLIIQQKMIGDVLLGSILCENIKKYYPNSVIDFVVYDFALGVIENNPYIDNYIVFKKSYRLNPFCFIKFLFGFRKKKYDFLIDSYGKLESIFISLFAQSKIKIAYYKKRTNFLYNYNIQRVSDKKRSHYFSIDNDLQTSIRDKLLLLSPILDKKANLIVEPKIYLKEEEIQKAEKDLENAHLNNKNLIMISALGSCKKKTYPLSYMAEVLDYIIENTNSKLLLNYAPNQRNLIKILLKNVKNKNRPYIITGIFGEKLRAFLSLAFLCKVIIGNEGGAINMAKALKKPTFAIFSPGIGPEGWLHRKDKVNVAVELSNYFPNYYENLSWKERSKNYKVFYNYFEPKLLKKDLWEFLKKNDLIIRKK